MHVVVPFCAVAIRRAVGSGCRRFRPRACGTIAVVAVPRLRSPRHPCHRGSRHRIWFGFRKPHQRNPIPNRPHRFRATSSHRLTATQSCRDTECRRPRTVTSTAVPHCRAAAVEHQLRRRSASHHPRPATCACAPAGHTHPTGCTESNSAALRTHKSDKNQITYGRRWLLNRVCQLLCPLGGCVTTVRGLGVRSYRLLPENSSTAPRPIMRPPPMPSMRDIRLGEVANQSLAEPAMSAQTVSSAMATITKINPSAAS